MSMEASNPIVGGTILRIPAIKSPNYVPGVSGWAINQDGTAEFQSVTLHGPLSISDLQPGTLASVGTLGAGGAWQSSASGTRIVLDANGLRLYNGATNTINLDATTGNGTFTGLVQTGSTGTRIVIDPTSLSFPTILFYPSSGSDYAYINSFAAGALGLNSGNGGGTTYAVQIMGSAQAYLNIETVGTQAQAGGKVEVSTTDAFINHTSGAAVTVDSNGVATLNSTSSGAFVQATASTMIVSGGNASTKITMTTTGFTWTIPNGGTGKIGSGVNTNTDSAWIASPTIDLGTGNSTDTVRSNSVFARTSTFTANVGIASTLQGVFFRLTSSARYKRSIEPHLPFDPYAVLDLKPVTYQDAVQVEEQGEQVAPHYLGLLAEDVDAHPTLGHLLAACDCHGRPESVNYDRVAVALIPAVADLLRRVEHIEHRTRNGRGRHLR